MKTKNLLLLSLALTVSLASCKKQPSDNENNSDPKPIALGTGVSVNTISKTVLTEETGFKAGDKIGITAVYSKKINSSSSNEDQPNWATADDVYFRNELATAAAGTAGADKVMINPFTWTNVQYYPQGKNIFLLAYYPAEVIAENGSSTTGVTYIDNKATANAVDEISVELKGETITAASADLDQPDVMIATHSKATYTAATTADPVTPGFWSGSINRESTTAETQLKFRHMLSQVRFLINREANVNANATCASLKITAPKYGRFPFGSDDVLSLYTKAATKVDVASTELTADDLVTYNINIDTDSQTQIPEKKSGVEPLDIMSFVTFTSKSLLLFPLTLDQLKKYCVMKLTVDFGAGYGTKEFEIKGEHFSKAFAQGAINTITFTVNYVEVKLTASVAPWTVGNNMDIPLE